MEQDSKLIWAGAAVVIFFGIFLYFINPWALFAILMFAAIIFALTLFKPEKTQTQRERSPDEEVVYRRKMAELEAIRDFERREEPNNKSAEHMANVFGPGPIARGNSGPSLFSRRKRGPFD